MKQDFAPEVLRVPGWDRYAWLRAGFSTRWTVCARELNLGWGTLDDEAQVRRNRVAFARAVTGGEPWPLVTVRQVHGSTVWNADAVTGPLSTAEGKAVLEGDGLIGATHQQLLAILTADCAPVLVADIRTHAVGAFHAGWRGTLARIAQRGITRMQECFGSRVEDLVAATGPCIGTCCFEVGAEVRAQFVAECTAAPAWFTPGTDGRFLMDLAEANRWQLREAGVPATAVASVALCTACARTAGGERHFFSYRAEDGRCGRMLSAIGSTA